ncbi:hypothetical protein MASR2M39_18150 [Ignavibacteriales bacterium]
MSACKDSPVEPDPNKNPEITFSDNPESNALTIEKNLGVIRAVAEKDKDLKINFRTKQNDDSFVYLRHRINQSADYRHIVIEKNNGDTANLLWGWKGIKPSIRLADNNGKTIVVDGVELEFAISSDTGTENPANQTANDFLILAMKVLGIAIAIWLGASVIKLVAAAIAFVAFNAMTFAFIAIAGSLAYIILKRVLDYMDWTYDDVVNFLIQSWNRILDLLHQLYLSLPGQE